MNPRVSRIRPILRPEQRRREREKKTRRRARDAIHRLRLEPRRARRTASSDPCAYDAHTKSRARRQSPRPRASSPSPRAPPLGSTVDHHPRHASPPTTRSRDARARTHTFPTSSPPRPSRTTPRSSPTRRAPRTPRAREVPSSASPRTRNSRRSSRDTTSPARRDTSSTTPSRASSRRRRVESRDDGARRSLSSLDGYAQSTARCETTPRATPIDSWRPRARTASSRAFGSTTRRPRSSSRGASARTRRA